MAKQKQMSVAARFLLIDEIYRVAYNKTESFEPDHLGIDLAYLFGAIVGNGSIDLDGDSVTWRLFMKWFGEGHAIWRFINTQ